MKVKQFLEDLNRAVKDRPDIGERELILSSDSEGNTFNKFDECSVSTTEPNILVLWPGGEYEES